jgi:hypothetical protein
MLGLPVSQGTNASSMVCNMREQTDYRKLSPVEAQVAKEEAQGVQGPGLGAGVRQVQATASVQCLVGVHMQCLYKQPCTHSLPAMSVQFGCDKLLSQCDNLKRPP